MMIATTEETTSNSTPTTFKIKVTNISPLVKEDILKKLFSFIGTIAGVELRQLDEQSVESLKEALIEFQAEDDVELSIHLTGVILVDRPLMVVKYATQQEEDNVVKEAEATTDNNEVQQQQQQQHSNNLCSVNVLNIPPGNFCTDDELRKFFVACGTIKSIQRQPSSSSSDGTIVLEFSSENYKQVALKLNGHYFKGLKLRIQDPQDNSATTTTTTTTTTISTKQDDVVSTTSSSKRDHYRRRRRDDDDDDDHYHHQYDRDRYYRDYYYSSRDRSRSRRDYNDDYYYSKSNSKSSNSSSRRRRHDY